MTSVISKNRLKENKMKVVLSMQQMNIKTKMKIQSIKDL